MHSYSYLPIILEPLKPPTLKRQILCLATPFHSNLLTPQQDLRVLTHGTLLANLSGFAPFVMAVAIHPSRSAHWHSSSVSKLKYILMTDAAMCPCCVTVDRFWPTEYLIWCRDLNWKGCLGNKKIGFKLAEFREFQEASRWLEWFERYVAFHTQGRWMNTIGTILLSLRSFRRMACCWDVFQWAQFFLASLE
jgi:hypothetical protein